MTASRPYIALCLVLLWTPAAAAQEPPTELPGRRWSESGSPPAYGTLALRGGFNGRGVSAYGEGGLRMGYHTRRLFAEAVLNLNQRQNFTFTPGRLIIEVGDDNVGFADSTSFEARPDTYSLDEPAGGRFGYRYRQWQVEATLSALVQRARLEQPEPQVTQQGLYFINWRSQGHHQARLAGSFSASYSFGPLIFRAGVLTLPLVQIGAADFKYAYHVRPRLFMALTAQVAGTRFTGSTDTKRLGLSVHHGFRSALFGRRSIAAGAGYRRGLEAYAFDALEVRVAFPVRQTVHAFVGYEQVWTRQSLRDAGGFAAWQGASVFGQLQPLNGTLAHQHVSFGLQVQLRRRAQPLPVRLLQARLLQEHIYSAKQAFYASNPVGLLDVYNAAAGPAAVQVVVETTEGRGVYRSEPFTLDAGELRQVPFYLYLRPDRTDDAMTSSEQLLVSAVVDGREAVLTSLPVTIYGRHAWDGDTWGLQYFVAPDDPMVKSRANRLFLGTLPAGVAPRTPVRQMDHLEAFIDALGAGLRYIPDPTTTRRVDQVQYPVETLAQGGGDCEDLTVLVASSLMAVGVQTAVVDIRPQTPTARAAPVVRTDGVGHVFLLIDTGLPPVALGELALSELQAVTRRGVNGRDTLWIPLEPTVIAEGFEAAFQAGARLYYQSVILNQGVVNGDVQIHDF